VDRFFRAFVHVDHSFVRESSVARSFARPLGHTLGSARAGFVRWVIFLCVLRGSHSLSHSLGSARAGVVGWIISLGYFVGVVGVFALFVSCGLFVRDSK
jgi:hypothetical protein